MTDINVNVPTNPPRNLPPGYHDNAVREIRVPRYANDPLRPNSTDTHAVDVSGWLYVMDGYHETQIRYITAWFATLSSWANLSKIATKAVAHKKIQEFALTSNESKTYIKEFLINTDHDYVFWKSQTKWLEAMTEALAKTIDNLRSYNSNLRASLTPGWDS